MPVAKGRGSDYEKSSVTLMNDLGKEGWMLVCESEAYLCFKRPVKKDDFLAQHRAGSGVTAPLARAFARFGACDFSRRSSVLER